MNQYLQDKQNDFESALNFFKKEIASLRTGRANPASLEEVKVEAYEVLNPLNAVANISLVDAHSIVVVPWDKSVIKAIEKAIIAAELGFTVVNEGDKIRLNVAPLTTENRQELIKKLNEKMEKSRISLRAVRETVKNNIEKAFEAKEISEDDKFRFIKELDEFSAHKNEELKNIRDRKEEDIKEV